MQQQVLYQAQFNVPKINLLSKVAYNYISPRRKHLMEDVSQSRSRFQSQNIALSLCTFTTWIKLNQKTKNGHDNRQTQDSSPSKRNEVHCSITSAECDRNTLYFHSFKKFNSFEFKFQKVFPTQETNFQIAKNINVFDELVINNKDFCLFTIGGLKSGIEIICQNKKKDGLFTLILCSLFDRIESVNQKKVQKVSDREFVSNLKLILKFVVISNEKFFDLNSPKYKVVLKENKSKYTLQGCQIFQPTSVYDISMKMQQMSKNRKLIYPQSIMIIEGEVSYDKPSIFGEISSFTGSFHLIQWQKSIGKTESNPTNANNNISLLNFNMCLYELYKGSCQSIEEFHKKNRKMWSIFRNSYITKILKGCILNCSKLILFACVGLEQDEQDVYHTLMLCKNAAKILWKGSVKFEEHPNDIPNNEVKKKIQLNNQADFISEPVAILSRSKLQKIDLSKVKQQLKKILKQKEMSEQKKKEKEVQQLLKIQARKKMQLRNIFNNKQQLCFREQITQISHSRNTQQTNLSAIIHQNKDNSKQISSLHSRTQQIQPQQENLIKEVRQIRSKLIKNIQESNIIMLKHNFLKHQIHQLQSDAIDYVTHKQNMINYLKEEIRELKKKQIQNRRVHSKQQRINEFKSIQPSKRRNKAEDEQLHKDSRNARQLILKDSRDTRQLTISKSRNERLKSQNQSECEQSQIKVLNRKSSLFQRRRVYLKQKIRKDKQKMNNYYDEVAKKFQQYSKTTKKNSI